MGLLDTINTLLRRGRQQEPTTADETAARQRGGASSLIERFQSHNTRKAVITECRSMYDGDPRARGIIQTLARDAVKGGFRLEVSDPRAADIAELLRQNLNLDGRLDDWTRLTLRDGDTMLEVGVTRSRDIAELTRKPTLQIHRNSDDRDKFNDPTRAFWMTEQPWLLTPGRDAIWFAEWQILHARWDHDEGNRYGTPLLAASRKAFKRLTEGELDIAIRRKTRAGMKYVHILEGAGEAEILTYQNINRDAIDNPFAAVQDFFMNGKGDLKPVQGDANLGQIDDIRHHLHTFWLASPVPMGVIGYGTDIDFSVVGHQKEQYDETLEEVQSWVADEFIRPLLKLQWLLKGIIPENLSYEIKWSPKKVTAADIEHISKAMLAFKSLGVPDVVIAMILARYLPGIEPEMILGDAGGNADVERLAGIAQRLAQSMGNKEQAQAKAAATQNGRNKAATRNKAPAVAAQNGQGAATQNG